MIKTLQISSILAVVLAVGLLVSSVVFGVQKNERIEQFLASASAKETFTEQIGEGMRTRRSSQRSPLVDRAQRFASIINPPKPKPKPQTTRQAPVAVKEAPRPEQTSAKFSLIGTSFYESNPQMSLAFIDQPGKGLHWVRQSDSVEHLVIEQVKDGAIVVRDGQRTFEMQTEERPAVSSTATSAIGMTPGRLPTTVTGRSRVGTTSRSAITNPRSPSRVPAGPDPRARTDERARLDALSSRLKALQADSKIGPSGQTDEAAEEAAALEMMKKLLADAQAEEAAARVSSEEAKNLDSLGKNLSSAASDPNKPGSGNTRRPIPPRNRATR